MFVRGPNPIWFMNNLTGSPLNDTYYAFFLTNDLPYVPQAVYQDPNGLIPWSDPIEFQPSGGLPNNLYFNETLVYRIEIRQGPDQTYPLIWLIENYVPAGSGEGPESFDSLTTAANSLVNPQFTDIFFSSPYTFTKLVSGTYILPVGPGWQLILTGTGTTILMQSTLPGSSDIQGNPAYYLQINNSGWTTAVLQQTFSNNGAIFAGGAIAVSFLAEATTTSQFITVQYAPSVSSVTPTTIFSGNITVGGFHSYYGAIDIPASTNTSTDGAAFVNINFNISGTGIIAFSNIQLTGQSTPLSSSFVSPSTTSPGSVPLYQEQTYAQIVNGEFNVFAESLVNQPKSSILTGWDFPLNPWQFTTITPTLLPNNRYTADQTIVVQQNYVATATGNNVLIGANNPALNYAFEAIAATANNQIAIIQYIDTSTVQPYWGSTLSSMVNAFLVTNASTNVTFKMRLIWNTSLPSPTSQTYPISSWTSGGDPVFAAGWTAILPGGGLNDPVYTLPTSATVDTGSSQNFSFDGFVLPNASSGAVVLGIVLYTTSNMGIATPDVFVLNRVSLVPNDFAIDCNPLTFDETLRQCQFYYEKSYDNDILPTSINANSKLMVVQDFNQRQTGGSIEYDAYAFPFAFRFNTVKRAIPNLTLYSPTSGAAGTVDTQLFNASPTELAHTVNSVGGFWQITALGTKGVEYLPGSSATTTTALIALPGSNFVTAVTVFHYTADARLGV